MKKVIISVLFLTGIFIFAEDYNSYKLLLLGKVPNGVTEGCISAWEGPGDRNPTDFIIGENGDFYFADINRKIILNFEEDLTFKDNILNRYSYSGLENITDDKFISYRWHTIYVSWNNDQDRLYVKVKDIIHDLDSSLFYQMHSFFYDEDGNIYCIPDPGPDYATFDAKEAKIYKNEEVVALFESDSGVDMKGLTIDGDYNLFDPEGNLLVRDLVRFSNYWSKHSNIDEFNKLDVTAEEIYGYQSQFMGNDTKGNYYWSNYKAVIVTNNKGQLLDLFLPDEPQKNRTRPAVHPNGDVYFLDYDEEWVYLYKIPNTWAPFIWEPPTDDTLTQRGRINSGGLRVRDNPFTTGTTVVGKLDLDTSVEILGQSADTMTIDGLTAPWYKIRTSEGLEGWVFGGYVDVE